MTVLPPLVSKALTDSGYDLVSSRDGGWFVAGISGSPATVLIQVVEEGVLLALPEAGTATRIGLEISGQVPPAGMASVGLARGASHIYEALRVLHTLLTHPVAVLSAQVEARLAAIPETERTCEVRQRIGQDVFREALMDLWQERCAVTGLAFPPKLLRASHAKPWAKATDSERLDPFNGLLLSIHLDAMFDAGLIAFSDEGMLLCSRRLDDAIRQHYSISDSLHLRTLSPGHIPYLAWHRTKIFDELSQNIL
jgi:putative restriction endonuclease